MEAAIEYLRKKGQKISEKRSDRTANQGLIVTKVSDDGHQAAAVELNCETDFVARNEQFQENAQKFVSLAFENQVENADELLELELDNGLTVADQIKDLVSKIGEKIKVSNAFFINSEGSIFSYIHPGNQLGVLVEFNDALNDDEVGRNVAMQVAAMNPLAVNRDGVDDDRVQKEYEIAKDQLLNEGKPENIAEKAANGKLNRFYEENVLLDQKYVKDNSMTVQEYLEDNDAPLVTKFWRLQLGEDGESEE
jgi:elongation factor Ts